MALSMLLTGTLRVSVSARITISSFIKVAAVGPQPAARSMCRSRKAFQQFSSLVTNPSTRPLIRSRASSVLPSSFHFLARLFTTTADGDNRYSPPTHSCKYCNKCFSATWECIDSNEKRLSVDLLLNGTDALSAALDGCQFFHMLLYPHNPGAETTKVRFILERKTSYRNLDVVGPYLKGKVVLEAPDPASEAPRDPNFWKESGAKPDFHLSQPNYHSFRGSAQSKGDVWFDGLLLPPNLNPLSKSSIELIKTWLNNSSARLQSSSGIKRVSASVMPKRLLKIEPGGDVVRVTRTDQVQAYALLSYCWGGDQESKTTSSNLDAHERGIEVDTLPETIRDAVLVTKHLNLKYLWVDALCIVQDDPNELAQEIANQAKVYQNGVVTILAGGAASASDGFLHRGPRTFPRFELWVRLPDGHERHIVVDTTTSPQLEFWPAVRELEPINTRGWIFQEVLLSPNIIYFSPNQIEMLSGSTFQTDGGLPSLMFENMLEYRTPIHGKLSATLLSSLEGNYNSLYSAWADVVYDYSGLKLTHSADKLLAVSAAAEALGVMFMGHEVASESYLAGLWRQHMPHNLLWHASILDLKQRPAYRAPSWSWASIDSLIMDNYETLGSPHPKRYTTTVLHAQTRLASRFAPYGQVLGGELQVDGLLKRIPSYIIDGAKIALVDEEYDFEHHTRLDAFQPELDTELGHEPELLVYLLCVIRWSYTEKEAQFRLRDLTASPNKSYGLILGCQPHANTFTRIGRYSLDGPDVQEDTKLMRWQKSFERKAITIV